MARRWERYQCRPHHAGLNTELHRLYLAPNLHDLPEFVACAPQGMPLATSNLPLYAVVFLQGPRLFE